MLVCTDPSVVVLSWWLCPLLGQMGKRGGGTVQHIDSHKNSAQFSYPYGIKRSKQKVPSEAPEKLYWSLAGSADNKLKEVLPYIHNVEQWKFSFKYLTSPGARNKLRRMIQINTIDRLLRGKYWLEDGRVVAVDKSALLESIKGTVIQDLKGVHDRAPAADDSVPCGVTVLHGDVLQAAHWLMLTGGATSPCILNPASMTNPGGGYRHGAGALEETMCRRTSLFMSLEDPWHMDSSREWTYPIPEFGGIYSPRVQVVRDTEALGYAFLPAPFEVAIVSSAAYAQPAVDILPDGTERLSKSLAVHTRKKIHGIFSIAHQQGHDALVLPAWGCGVFGNPAQHIAALFGEVSFSLLPPLPPSQPTIRPSQKTLGPTDMLKSSCMRTVDGDTVHSNISSLVIFKGIISWPCSSIDPCWCVEV